MDYISALSVLVVTAFGFGMVLNKFDSSQVLGLLDSRGFLLMLATVLFALVLVAHLFHDSDWTADLLKVLVGVLVGAGSALSKKGEVLKFDFQG